MAEKLKQTIVSLVFITLLQACSSTEDTSIKYDYPKSKSKVESDEVGSLMQDGGLYLIKPESRKDST